MRLTARQLLRCSNIAELAAVAGPPGGGGEADTAPDGPVPLTPIQHWFFEQPLENPNHFNQSVLLELKRPLDPSVLERSVEALLRHHDALRLRYGRRGTGEFEAAASPEVSSASSTLDLSLPPTAA